MFCALNALQIKFLFDTLTKDRSQAEMKRSMKLTQLHLVR